MVLAQKLLVLLEVFQQLLLMELVAVAAAVAEETLAMVVLEHQVLPEQ